MNTQTLDKMTPPWEKYPECKCFSIGWRMGRGEDYMDEWRDYINAMTQIETDEYFSSLSIPEEWERFVDQFRIKD